MIAGALFFSFAAVSLSVWHIFFYGGAPVILFSLIAFAMVIFAIVSLVLAFGLWNARGWAWTWTLISSILGLVVSIIGIAVGVGIIGIVIYAVIIYYLTRARVKAFFGKGGTTSGS